MSVYTAQVFTDTAMVAFVPEYEGIGAPNRLCLRIPIDSNLWLQTDVVHNEFGMGFIRRARGVRVDDNEALKDKAWYTVGCIHAFAKHLFIADPGQMHVQSWTDDFGRRVKTPEFTAASAASGMGFLCGGIYAIGRERTAGCVHTGADGAYDVTVETDTTDGVLLRATVSFAGEDADVDSL